MNLANPSQDWILPALKRGLQQLVFLSLEGQPSADLIAGTLLSWGRVIRHRRVFEQVRDEPRFDHAFLALQGTCKRWPAPSDFIEALPRIEVSAKTTLRIESQATQEAAQKARTEIEGVIKRYEVTKPKRLPPLKPVDDFPRCCENGTREKPMCDACRSEMNALHGPVREFDKSQLEVANESTTR